MISSTFSLKLSSRLTHVLPKWHDLVEAVAVAMEEVDIVVDVAVAEAVVVSSDDPFLPPFHLLMELTRSLVGGFTSSNAAPLGGSRRW